MTTFFWWVSHCQALDSRELFGTTILRSTYAPVHICDSSVFLSSTCHMPIPITVKANCDIKMFSHMNHNQVKIYLFSFYKSLWYFRWCLQNRIFFHSVSTCSFATTLIVSATETCSSSSISLFNRTSSLMNSSSWILFLIPYRINIGSMFGNFLFWYFLCPLKQDSVGFVELRFGFLLQFLHYLNI